MLGISDYGGAVRERRRRAATSSARSSTPRSRRSHGLRTARATSPRSARHGLPGVILYPAIDILDGKAVRLVQGDFERQHRLPRLAARGGARVGRGRRALPARRRPRRRADGAPREPRAPRADHRASSRVPVQFGGGLRSLASVRDALRRRRRARDPRHGGATTTSTSSTTCSARFRERVIVVGRHARRQGLDARAGTESDGDAGRGRDRAPAAPRRALVRLHRTSTATGCSRAPTSTRCSAIAQRRARALHLLRRRSARSTTCARSPRCGRSTSAA